MNRRTSGVLAVAALVAAVCVVAGFWQWERHVDRSETVSLVEANYDAEPRPLTELVPGDALPREARWHPVTVVGRYLPDATVLLRNRPVAGTAAFHVLDLFEITEGEHAGQGLVVHRGWVPAGDDLAAPEPPGPPPGEITVVARLREPESRSARDAPPGQVQTVEPDQVRDAAGAELPVLQAYGIVVTEDGARPSGTVPLDRPSPDLGPHLSYAFQWWLFAVGALVGAVVLLRRDRAEESDVGVPPARGRSRGPTAEDEEDALVDAALRDAASDAGATQDAGASWDPAGPTRPS